MSIEKQELDELCAKLAALDLSDDQRLLLDSVLLIAWDFVGSRGDLDAQFDGCFEAGEAEMIMAYSSATKTKSNTRLITAKIGTDNITCAIPSR